MEVKAAAANGGKTYEVAQITYIYANQTAITLSGKAYSELVSGDTLTLKAGYCIYYLNQGAAIALSRLTEDCKFVWNGASWENFTAEATELELEKEEITLPRRRILRGGVQCAPRAFLRQRDRYLLRSGDGGGPGRRDYRAEGVR